MFKRQPRLVSLLFIPRHRPPKRYTISTLNRSTLNKPTTPTFTMSSKTSIVAPPPPQLASENASTWSARPYGWWGMRVVSRRAAQRLGQRIFASGMQYSKLVRAIYSPSGYHRPDRVHARYINAITERAFSMIQTVRLMSFGQIVDPKNLCSEDQRQDVTMVEAGDDMEMDVDVLTEPPRMCSKRKRLPDAFAGVLNEGHPLFGQAAARRCNEPRRQDAGWVLDIAQFVQVCSRSSYACVESYATSLPFHHWQMAQIQARREFETCSQQVEVVQVLQDIHQTPTSILPVVHPEYVDVEEPIVTFEEPPKCEEPPKFEDLPVQVELYEDAADNTMVDEVSEEDKAFDAEYECGILKLSSSFAGSVSQEDIFEYACGDITVVDPVVQVVKDTCDEASIIDTISELHAIAESPIQHSFEPIPKVVAIVQPIIQQYAPKPAAAAEFMPEADGSDAEVLLKDGLGVPQEYEVVPQQYEIVPQQCEISTSQQFTITPHQYEVNPPHQYEVTPQFLEVIPPHPFKVVPQQCEVCSPQQFAINPQQFEVNPLQQFEFTPQQFEFAPQECEVVPPHTFEVVPQSIEAYSPQQFAINAQEFEVNYPRQIEVYSPQQFAVNLQQFEVYSPQFSMNPQQFEVDPLQQYEVNPQSLEVIPPRPLEVIAQQFQSPHIQQAPYIEPPEQEMEELFEAPAMGISADEDEPMLDDTADPFFQFFNRAPYCQSLWSSSDQMDVEEEDRLSDLMVTDTPTKPTDFMATDTPPKPNNFMLTDTPTKSPNFMAIDTPVKPVTLMLTDTPPRSVAPVGMQIDDPDIPVTTPTKCQARPERPWTIPPHIKSVDEIMFIPTGLLGCAPTKDTLRELERRRRQERDERIENSLARLTMAFAKTDLHSSRVHVDPPEFVEGSSSWPLESGALGPSTELYNLRGKILSDIVNTSGVGKNRSTKATRKGLENKVPSASKSSKVKKDRKKTTKTYGPIGMSIFLKPGYVVSSISCKACGAQVGLCSGNSPQESLRIGKSTPKRAIRSEAAQTPTPIPTPKSTPKSTPKPALVHTLNRKIATSTTPTRTPPAIQHTRMPPKMMSTTPLSSTTSDDDLAASLAAFSLSDISPSGTSSSSVYHAGASSYGGSSGRSSSSSAYYSSDSSGTSFSSASSSAYNAGDSSSGSIPVYEDDNRLADSHSLGDVFGNFGVVANSCPRKFKTPRPTRYRLPVAPSPSVPPLSTAGNLINSPDPVSLAAAPLSTTPRYGTPSLP